MEEEEDFVGCINCMSTSDLCDLFVKYANNEQTYAQMLKTCFNIKVTNDYKYICTNCVEKLEKSLTFRNQTVKSMEMLQIIKDEEYLDETILEEEENEDPSKSNLRKFVVARKTSDNCDNDEDEDNLHEIEALDETRCLYCDLQLPTVEEVHHHIRLVHGLEPRTGRRVRECNLCGASLRNLEDHLNSYNLDETRCLYCDLQLPTVEEVHHHIRLVHGLEPRTGRRVRECNLCGASLRNLEDHLNSYNLDETRCLYCDLQLPTVEEVHHHIRLVHGLEPRTGRRVRECNLCGASLRNLEDHLNRCHNTNSEKEGREYACHFCDNVYISKKACFTHLRMKHGLKLCNDHVPKYSSRDRKKCHICGRDFSQKQILNNHLWKAHGFEVEKRKAFFCPLCSDRVSYGANFSAHLLHSHHVTEQVQQLEFATMDDFLLYKSEIQEETKYRFRKTTASKQTIEGIRSHYMCSQSGIYVYQGKGKRLAPERQIYKTGKACPAHMIVTETLDKVLVTFYMTHVGHGTCPYYEPRVPKHKQPAPSTSMAVIEEGVSETLLVCDTCGATLPAERLHAHVASHGRELYQCEYCAQIFQNLEEWTHHLRVEHSIGTVY